MAAINKGANPSKVTPSNITFALKPDGSTSATLAGIILNFAVEASFELTQQTINTAGITAEERVDGRRWNLTGTVRYLNSATIYPQQGDQITVAGAPDTNHNTIYMIDTVSTPYEFGKFVDVAITAHKLEGITLS